MTPTPPQSRRPTLHDVALHAEVSVKTASRVVNREGGVSPALTARVERAIAALGYRPDERARRLRQATSGTGTIGFVLVDVANPFFSGLLRGMEDVARSRGCLVLSGSTDGSPARQRQLVESFIDRRVDGLVVVPSGSDAPLLRSEIERGSSIVLLDLELDVDAGVDLVRSDHYGGAKMATEHLISHGHRNIAYMGDDLAIFSARQRLQGFSDAMAATGLAVHDDWTDTGTRTVAEWRQVGRDFFQADTGATAIFTAQNFVTLGVVEALHDLDLQHRIALVGFDDVDLAAALDPGITVVPQSPQELGRRAAELLFDRIDGNARAPVRDIVAHRLIIRGSGEIKPA